MTRVTPDSHGPSHGRLRPFHVALALAALVAVAYGGSLRNELVFDDLIFMQRDPRVQSLARVGDIFSQALWSFGEADDAQVHQYYRPLQLLPLAASHAAFGSAAWPSHLLSLLLHLANCLLAYALFRALMIDAVVAALLAALFAVYSGYSEAVLWASDIAGLGAAFCTLTIVNLHVAAPRPRSTWLLSPLLLLCGVWFKESGVLAIPLVAAYDLVGAPDRGWRRMWANRWRYAVWAPPLALYGTLRLRALGGLLPGVESVPLSGVELLLNGLALLPTYALAWLWPFSPNMYHDFAVASSFGDPRVLCGMGLAAAALLVFGVTARRREHRAAAFGIAWAILAVAPHLLVRWPQLNVFAERYLYLPSVGLLIVVGHVWQRQRARLRLPARRAVVGGVLGLLALFVLVDLRRTADWRDEVTIYRATLTQSARAELIRTNLAIRLLELRRYDEGIAVLDELQRINPEWPDVAHNLGLLYLGKGDTAAATRAFEQAAGRPSARAATFLNLGYLYDRGGRREAAVQTYLRAVQLAPRAPDAWYNLGVIALETGQLENARNAAARVLAAAPDDSAAAALMRRAEAATPRRQDDAATLERCKRARAAADAGNFDQAILALKTAAWLDEAAPLPHQYLANVYYLQGRLRAALRHQRAAVRRAPNQPLYRANLRALRAALTAQRATRRGGTSQLTPPAAAVLR